MRDVCPRCRFLTEPHSVSEHRTKVDVVVASYRCACGQAWKKERRAEDLSMWLALGGTYADPHPKPRGPVGIHVDPGRERHNPPKGARPARRPREGTA